MDRRKTPDGVSPDADTGTGVRMRIIGHADPTSPGPGPELMTSDALENAHVFNLSGKELGKLAHIVLDIQCGRIAYAVVSVGGFWGIGNRLLAVPWSAMVFDAISENFLLDISQERLDGAPGFGRVDRPAMVDQAWAQFVHDYYDARPYWA